MIVAVPKEIKDHEYRVGLTPDAVQKVVQAGHRVLVEKGAGDGSGFSDETFIQAGGEIVDERERLFSEAEIIVKVKEPQPSEYELFRRGQALFTFLHLAANRPLTVALQERGVTAIAYEGVRSSGGALPLLKPMSEIAGRMSVLMGAYFLQKGYGGSGVLFSGATDAEPARIVVLGAGTVGSNAVLIALGLRARVILFYREGDRLPEVGAENAARFETRKMGSARKDLDMIGGAVTEADLVIGAVLVKDRLAPKLVSRSEISKMRSGSVIVDVSIDQGGCFETSRPTTHSDPVYRVDGVLHYCVANMPGAYPPTATQALVNKTLPYVLELVSRGPLEACRENPLLGAGLAVHDGVIRNPGVAEAHGLEYKMFG